MEKLNNTRIRSLDLLKGLIMIIMALDHTRDYFHYYSFHFDPTDPEHTSTMIFFTRWITHFCAPVFSLLAGVSAYLVGIRKSKKELSKFLLSRGIWLLLIEVTVVNFGWFFNIHFTTIPLQVIWVLGISMILLSAIIHLPIKAILGLSLLVIFGHNLLDNVHFENNFFWSMLHERHFFIVGEHRIATAYPVIPWFAVMSLGYVTGSLYQKTSDPDKRKRLLKITGFTGLCLFFVVRGINGYGNSYHWQNYPTNLQTAFGFLDPEKYPPSLSYLLMTVSVAFLFLAYSENLKGKMADIISVYGKVPFFYYILHLYLIHIFAMILAQLTGFGWQAFILEGWVGGSPDLQGYGLNLFGTYIVWLSVVISLFPLCKKFSDYKLQNKDKWWLSYL